MGNKQFTDKDGKTITESGLLGYYDGTQTIFFNAADGSAKIGADDNGQIIIDYKNNKVKLVSKPFNSLVVLLT